MRRPHAHAVHVPGIFRRILERVRGREQRLVRGPGHWPLLLLSFPRGDCWAADEVGEAWLHTLPALECAAVQPYRAMMAMLPALVVVLLRRRNVCTCLGHHHPKGTESRLTRRLAGDIGGNVGELDLAWESIREWKPRPLSALASGAPEPLLNGLHVRAALLTVLLHEMEHLAHPDRAERTVRNASDGFYAAVMAELLRNEGGAAYGMAAGL